MFMIMFMFTFMFMFMIMFMITPSQSSSAGFPFMFFFSQLLHNVRRVLGPVFLGDPQELIIHSLRVTIHRPRTLSHPVAHVGQIILQRRGGLALGRSRTEVHVTPHVTPSLHRLDFNCRCPLLPNLTTRRVPAVRRLNNGRGGLSVVSPVDTRPVFLPSDQGSDERRQGKGDTQRGVERHREREREREREGRM